jgi:hypothetical protein
MRCFLPLGMMTGKALVYRNNIALPPPKQTLHSEPRALRSLGAYCATNTNRLVRRQYPPLGP